MKNLGTDLEAALSPTDRELVESCKAGDEKAFATLFERHRYSIYSRTLTWCISRSDAEEVTQDTFICAYKNMRKFRGDCEFATWIFRIARNRATNKCAYWQRRKHDSHFSLQMETCEDNICATVSELIAGDFSVEREIVLKEFGEIVARAFPRLSIKHQEIMRLRDMEERSYVEIAQILSIHLGTVRSRLARAREMLRRHIEHLFPSLKGVDLRRFLHFRGSSAFPEYV